MQLVFFSDIPETIFYNMLCHSTALLSVTSCLDIAVVYGVVRKDIKIFGANKPMIVDGLNVDTFVKKILEMKSCKSLLRLLA